MEILENKEKLEKLKRKSIRKHLKTELEYKRWKAKNIRRIQKRKDGKYMYEGAHRFY